MLKLAFITLGFVAVAVLLLCVRMILLPGGRFRSFHVGESKEMRKRGIHCVQSMDYMERKINPHAVREREVD
ncbi:MAG TPA: hypothetical protein DDW22_04220 [Prevotellaceae bacterium]|nr:hypothetical protein [Prevotellaceae bacterium]